MTRNPTFEILLVDDNRGDGLLATRAFSEGRSGAVLTIVQTGENAIDILHRKGDRAEKTLPDLILLDIQLPRMDGMEVLRTIRNDPGLAHLPVIMMSGSDNQDTVNSCYRAGASAYIAKPRDMASYRRTAARIEDFYLDLCSLPVVAT